MALSSPPRNASESSHHVSVPPREIRFELLYSVRSEDVSRSSEADERITLVTRVSRTLAEKLRVGVRYDVRTQFIFIKSIYFCSYIVLFLYSFTERYI